MNHLTRLSTFLFLFLSSINALTFSPDGTLFIGDSKSARVFAYKPEQDPARNNFENINISGIDESIAEVLGTKADDLTFQDMAVHPVSGNIYMALHLANNRPVLLTVSGTGDILPVDLQSVSLEQKSIKDPVATDAEDRRGRSLRHWAISDMHYADGKLLLTGLSNREFGSTFRSMSYPFLNDEDDATLEIYHAAHGQYETHAPVKTFTTARVNGKTHVIASYTCTPLVLFPMDDLKAGKHIKGRTVAELGAGNTPLDMVIIEKGNDSILLMANTNRPVMKILLSDIAGYSGSLTSPVETPAATAGVDHISFPMTNVLQMDKWGENNWLMLKRHSNGDLALVTGNEFWL
ncbi:MAG: hypothetical protein P8X57_11750 [Cyclobacteriaceae bacterium]